MCWRKNVFFVKVRCFETLSPFATIQAQESISICARQLKDNNFLLEYGHIDFIAKEGKYHKHAEQSISIKKEMKIV